LSSTYFETEGSSSGRLLYIQLWYGMFSMHQYKHTFLPTRLFIPMHVKVPYLNCTYVRFHEDEPSGSKHVEDIKIKN